MSKGKALFEMVRELIDAYDKEGCQLTEPVRHAINALRPYLFTAEETRKRYAQVETFPKSEG